MRLAIPGARALACAALATTLAACGGGSDPAPQAAATQGFWSGPMGAETTASAVFLAEGPAMIVLQSGAATSLVMADSRVEASRFTLEGRRYDLAAGGSAPFSASGTVTPGERLAFAAGAGWPASTLAYDAAYERPARLDDVRGAWRAGLAGGTLTLSLEVAEDGKVRGTNSSGCRYAGEIAPHAGGVAVFDLALTESCAGRAALDLAGIATYDARRAVLSAALVSDDGATASLFQARR